MPRSLSWDDLRFFLAVRDRGSIGGAAKWLGVNHSTVLRHVSNLEETLGVRLFDRLPTGYALTPGGLELASGLEGVRDRIEAVQQQLGDIDTAVRGVVRVATADTILPVLLPHFTSFRCRYPDVDLEVSLDTAPHNLFQREADVAIRATNHPPENLVGRCVGTMQCALYASRDYLEGLGPGKERAFTWIGPDDSLAHLGSHAWLRRNVPSESVRLRFDSLISIADAVSAGLGVAILLYHIAEQRPGLVRIDGPFDELARKVWILTHPDLRRVKRIAALTEHLVERLRQEPLLGHAEATAPRASK